MPNCCVCNQQCNPGVHGWYDGNLPDHDAHLQRDYDRDVYRHDIPYDDAHNYNPYQQSNVLCNVERDEHSYDNGGVRPSCLLCPQKPVLLEHSDLYQL